MRLTSRFIPVLFLLFVAVWAQAQTNRYMVFFTDKADNGFDVTDPSAFLTERAISRKDKFGIAITEQDLPVSQPYLNQLEATSPEIEVYFSSKWLNAAVVQMDQQWVTTVTELPFVSEVEYVSRNARLTRDRPYFELPSEFLEPSFVSGDPTIQREMLGAVDMFEGGYNGEGMLIAVFDGGFTGTHQFKTMSHIFEQNRLVAVRDFVYDSFHPFRYNSHGTSVLSCLAADYKGFVGTAPKASYILCVTEDVSSESRIEEYNWLIAAEFADSLGADIIHSSLGYYDFNESFMNYTYSQMDGTTSVVSKAASLAMEKGMLVVTSAGNEGSPSNKWKYITAPADGIGVLAVGAVTSQYLRSSFSSVGPTADGRIKPDVMALGTSVVIMNGSGAIVTGNGTSYAAPLVAGLAAGLWQANPDWTNYQLANRIRATASRALTPDSLYGYGIPGFRAAQEGRILAVQQLLSEQVNVFPNPFAGEKLFMDIRDVHEALPISVIIYDTDGRKIVDVEIKRDFYSQDVIELEVSATKAGVYIMQLKSAHFSKQIKLIHY